MVLQNAMPSCTYQSKKITTTPISCWVTAMKSSVRSIELSLNTNGLWNSIQTSQDLFLKVSIFFCILSMLLLISSTYLPTLSVKYVEL